MGSIRHISKVTNGYTNDQQKHYYKQQYNIQKSYLNYTIMGSIRHISKVTNGYKIKQIEILKKERLPQINAIHVMTQP